MWIVYIAGVFQHIGSITYLNLISSIVLCFLMRYDYCTIIYEVPSQYLFYILSYIKVLTLRKFCYKLTLLHVLELPI